MQKRKNFQLFKWVHSQKFLKEFLKEFFVGGKKIEFYCSANINVDTNFCKDITKERSKKFFLSNWPTQLAKLATSMVLTYRKHGTIANTIAPLLNLSDPRKILRASEADTLELCVLLYRAITTVCAAGPSRRAYCLSSVRLVVRDARGRVMNDETFVNLYWFAIRPTKVFAVVSDQELGQEHDDACVGDMTMIDGDLGVIEPF
jgi:hypothetical protein